MTGLWVFMMMIKTATADEKAMEDMARLGSAFWTDKNYSCGGCIIRIAIDEVPAM